jgi:hypothetical protein
MLLRLLCCSMGGWWRLGIAPAPRPHTHTQRRPVYPPPPPLPPTHTPTHPPHHRYRHFRSAHSDPLNIALHLVGLAHAALANFALLHLADMHMFGGGRAGGFAFCTLTTWVALLVYVARFSTQNRRSPVPSQGEFHAFAPFEART